MSILFAEEAPPAAATLPPAEPDHLPHGIRGLVTYERTIDLSWLVILLVVLLAALIGWLIYRQYKKRKKPKITVHPLSALYQEIKKYEPDEPLRGAASVEYFFRLNLYLRQFLEMRLKFPATDLTYKELKAPLKKHLPFDEGGQLAVLKFLERSDTIKFAHQEASFSEAQDAHQDVLKWLRSLMPSSEELDLEVKKMNMERV